MSLSVYVSYDDGETWQPAGTTQTYLVIQVDATAANAAHERAMRALCDLHRMREQAGGVARLLNAPNTIEGTARPKDG